MKFIPIVLSTPMVQAILQGHKTQTRRIVKGIPENLSYESVQIMVSGLHSIHGNVKCPYGKPGDILWVKETYVNSGFAGGDKFHYNADGDNGFIKWTPSIHMPKEACRIFLKVKSVRVERLQDIDRKGAAAEGIQSFWRQDGTSVNGIPGLICPNPNQYWTKIEAFRKLWQSIYGAESWEANPWVWVVEFERTNLTNDQMKQFLTK